MAKTRRNHVVAKPLSKQIPRPAQHNRAQQGKNGAER